MIDNQLFTIFAQAPTPPAIASFWKAILDHKVTTIFMLCSFDDPIRGHQSDPYWPKSETTI